MSDKASSNNPQSLIADAIRNKRDGRASKLVREEIEAMELALLADLDNFDPDAMARRMNGEPRPVLPGRARDAAFPSLDPAAVRQPAAARPTPLAQAPVESQPTAQPAATAPRRSVLDQLRQETEARQHQINDAQQQATQREVAVDQALRRVFAYLHEFVQQLNFLRHPVPRGYRVTPAHALDGLRWDKGFADFRTRADSAGGLLEYVSLNYRLSGENALEIERDGLIAEKFRKALFDQGLEFTLDEIRNERRSLERARFVIAPEVKVNLRWDFNPDSGRLRIVARNLERFGNATYEVALDQLDSALLDDFALLLLGQPTQFSRLYAC